MRLYELVLVFRTSLSEGERKKFLETVKGLLKDLKIKEEDLGQKPLAYAIKREAAGYYIKMELEGENIPAGFETRMAKNEDVLRHLLLRKK